jgi:hypothetical protein
MKQSKSLSLTVLVVLAVLSSGCGIKFNIPNPGTTPPVVTEPPVKPQPQCIGENKTGCYVSQNGKDLYVCPTPWLPGGIALATDPASCPTAPVIPDPPKPPLVADYCITPGPDWQLQPRTTAPHNDILNTIMRDETGCNISSDCVIKSDRIDFMNRIIATLNGLHYCAGVQVLNGDKVAVGTQYDNWTYHLVGTGRNTVAWQPNKVEPPDHWIATGPVFPPMKQFGRGPSLTVTHPNCWIIDGTPLTNDGEFCKREFPNQSAQWGLCPFGGEGNPNRILGETAAGPYTLSFNGERQDPNTNADGSLNPIQMKICGAVTGIAEICAYNYGNRICQTAEVK